MIIKETLYAFAEEKMVKHITTITINAKLLIKSNSKVKKILKFALI